MEYLDIEQIEEITDLIKEEMGKVFKNENKSIIKCCKSIYYEMMAKYYKGW